MKEKIHPAGLGRGTHPNSRKNLTGAKRDSYVFALGTDGVWHKIGGPFTYHHAFQAAARLEAMNATSKKPMYVATTYNPNDAPSDE